MKRLIGASIVLIFVGVAGYFYFLRTVPSLGSASMPTPTASTTDTGVSYTADGKLDTSNWQEYRSEYGGFSVRAPKGLSTIGCFGHACNPSVDGARFVFAHFLTNINDEFGAVGFSIEMIRKSSISTLDTWFDDYIVSGRDQFVDVQKVLVNGHPALQFDWRKETGAQAAIYIRDGLYPKGDVYTSIFIDPASVTGVNSSSRFLVIDLGDRYALVFYMLSLDRNALAETYRGYGYPDYQQQALAVPNDKTLSDIYTAILDSFQAFTPTKS